MDLYGVGWRDANEHRDEMAAVKKIESAPKDGSRIMIFDGQWHFACWSDEADYGLDPDTDNSMKVAPGWQIFRCDDPYYAEATAKATHWMPAPQAPALVE